MGWVGSPRGPKSMRPSATEKRGGRKVYVLKLADLVPARGPHAILRARFLRSKSPWGGQPVAGLFGVELGVRMERIV
jgi:hypothetical protein